MTSPDLTEEEIARLVKALRHQAEIEAHGEPPQVYATWHAADLIESLAEARAERDASYAQGVLDEYGRWRDFAKERAEYQTMLREFKSRADGAESMLKVGDSEVTRLSALVGGMEKVVEAARDVSVLGVLPRDEDSITNDEADARQQRLVDALAALSPAPLPPSKP